MDEISFIISIRSVEKKEVSEEEIDYEIKNSPLEERNIDNNKKIFYENDNIIKENTEKMPIQLPRVQPTVPLDFLSDDTDQEKSPSPKPKKTTTRAKKTPVRKTPSPRKSSPKRTPTTVNGPPAKLPGLSESGKFYYNSKGEKKSVKNDEKGLYYLGATDRKVRIKSS